MKISLSKWKKSIVVFGIVLVIALVLRIYNLTLLPVFADEAIYIRWSQVMASEATLRFLPLSDGKQPLFMWILMFLVKHFSDPLFVGRLMSVGTGLVTVIGVFLLAKLIFRSNRSGILAGFLWAISPFALFFDRMALVDSMLAALGIWTLLLGVLAAKTKRLDLAMLTGFCLGFAALTKSPALFFALFLPSTWLLSKWQKNRRGNAVHLVKLAVLILVTYTIAFGMYNILHLGPNFHLISLRNFDYVYPYSHIFQSPFDPFKGHIQGILNYFIQFAPLGLTLLILLSVVGNFKKYSREIVLLAIWGIVPILIIAEYSKVVTARYVLYVLPFLVVLAAGATELKPNLMKKAVYLFLATFILQSVVFDVNLLTNVEAANLPYGDRSGYLEEWTAGQGIKEISDYIKAQHNSHPDNKIVIGTEGYFGTLPDGLQMYLEGVPNVITVGVGIGFRELPKSLSESKKAGNKTYLVINKSRLGDSPDKLGLKLVAEYPKALRRLGSREYQMYGPQEVLYFFEVIK